MTNSKILARNEQLQSAETVSAHARAVEHQHVECELHIEIDKDQRVRYEGTRAQLEDEGIIPEGTKWPVGKNSVDWEANGLVFWLSRCRPRDMKGPMKLWLEGDFWKLSFSPRGHSCMDGAIKGKARELREMLYCETEQGRRHWSDTWRRAKKARDDEQFQAFKALIPALMPPKRGRRGRVNHE
jgi:hypothetical protein